MIARTLVVHGRVQGVGFRYSMVDFSTAIGLRGWVRNRRDGSVEAFVQGEPAAVERAIAWCRRGPTGALVTSVDVVEAEVDPRCNGFATRPTV
jgi:acylphosphatase